MSRSCLSESRHNLVKGGRFFEQGCFQSRRYRHGDQLRQRWPGAPKAIEADGAEKLCLPPCSADLNQIGLAVAKLQALLRATPCAPSILSRTPPIASSRTSLPTSMPTSPGATLLPAIP
jgi:hypothetical protein